MVVKSGSTLSRVKEITLKATVSEQQKNESVKFQYVHVVFPYLELMTLRNIEFVCACSVDCISL